MKVEFFKSSNGYICCRDGSGNLIFISDKVKEAIKEGGLAAVKGKIRLAATDDGQPRIQFAGEVETLGTMTL